MKTVNIGVLKNQLSAYLQYVRAGEEVLIQDRNQPIARIVPIALPAKGDREAEAAYLIATGQMKEAEQEMDWDAFWALPSPSVPEEAVNDAIAWTKGDR
jgi:prevent-host-death family protein